MVDLTAAVLAIDGGNSKTDVALIGQDGQVHGFARGGGSCYQVIGLAPALAVITELVAKVRAEAGVADDLTLAAQVHACLAGADFESEVALLRRSLVEYGWAPRTAVENDSFALLRAGTSAPNAVAVVCGAGINCVGTRADGRVSRFQSLGRISGDWGGGNQLGYDTLWLAVRAEDGRGEPSALRDAVLEAFGYPSMEEVSAAFHFGDLTADRVHDLVRVLFTVAHAGDQVARALVKQLADEVVSMATIALRRLELTAQDAVVVLGGGVLTARQPILNEAIIAGITERAPRASVVVSEYPPIVGAALRAFGSDVTADIERMVQSQVLERLAPGQAAER
jgi:N-acetylglucosamine kinase-like BadF-type ATPase